MAVNGEAATLRVGAVACPVRAGDVAGNLAEISCWVEQARRLGIELLLFPELSLTGYYTNGQAPLALTQESSAVAAVRRLAQTSGVALAVGLAWQDEGEQRPYIAHGLWLPSGACYLYRKTHLGEREQRWFARGNALPVFTLPRLRLGFQLCLEQHFPEASQTLALRGAELLLCPHATPRLAAPLRRESWHISLRARAYDNCVYVLACNAVGDNGQGTPYHGGLLLVDPFGRVLAEDFSGQPALISGEINIAAVTRAHRSPEGTCRRFFAPYRRPELYEYQTGAECGRGRSGE